LSACVSYRAYPLTTYRVRRLLVAFRDERAGTSVAEYGLLLALVAVVLMFAVNLAGTKIRGFWGRATCAVYGACGDPASPAGGGGGGGNNGGGNNTGTSNNGGGNNTGGSGG
jgi:Flp pilus assembly pilin Flp